MRIRTDEPTGQPTQEDMDPSRWRMANDIFHAALDLPFAEQTEFVGTASNGDTALHAEVIRLLEADQRAGSYLETPILQQMTHLGSQLSESPFAAGDVLKNRFRIVRHVGEGGMGHVFEAQDTELNVRIALKAIRPEIAGDPRVLAFFRREVLIARTITHLNVCRTFDLDRGFLGISSGSQIEFFFLTMEFLEGETLATKLKRAGPLAPDEAVAIARPIALALDAAHAAGIVHRDVKPANIMLAPVVHPAGSGPRVVITDFGLARRNPLQPSLELSAISQAGPIGTLAYMAPEQMGLESTVSFATDIYAFGLILFEMVTGVRAFPSTDLLGGIAQRISGPSPSPMTMVPGLPPVWETVIQRCLSIDPRQRFQSAIEVSEALEGRLSGASDVLEKLSSYSVWDVRLRQFMKGNWFSRRSFFKLAAILLGIMALIALGLRLYRSEADSKIATGALVYLTPVKNMTNEQSLDNLTELLQAGLKQSAHINLLDQSRVGDTLQLMTKPPDTVIDQPAGREIALRTGAARVVFVTVTGGAGHYQLEVEIQRPDPSGVFRYYEHWPKTFSWQTSGSTNDAATISPELLTTVRNTSNWIRTKAGESKDDIARLDVPLEDATTNSWQALTEYESAERFSRKGNSAEAVGSLQTAVMADPAFALAFGRLGDILAAMGSTGEAYAAYQRALTVGAERRLTRRERDRIKGMYAVDTGDVQAAEDAFRDYSNYYENDPWGGNIDLIR